MKQKKKKKKKKKSRSSSSTRKGGSSRKRKGAMLAKLVASMAVLLMLDGMLGKKSGALAYRGMWGMISAKEGSWGGLLEVLQHLEQALPAALFFLLFLLEERREESRSIFSKSSPSMLLGENGIKYVLDML